MFIFLIVPLTDYPRSNYHYKKISCNRYTDDVTLIAFATIVQIGHALTIPGHLIGSNASYVEFELQVAAMSIIERVAGPVIHNPPGVVATYSFATGRLRGRNMQFGRKFLLLLALEHKSLFSLSHSELKSLAIKFTVGPGQHVQLMETANVYHYEEVKLRYINEQTKWFKTGVSYSPWEIQTNITWIEPQQYHVQILSEI